MRLGRLLGRTLAGALGAAAGMRSAPPTVRWIGPVEVEMSLSLGGGTRVDLRPLGVATFRTHRGPLRLRVRPTGIDPARSAPLLRVTGAPTDRMALQQQLRAAGTAVGADAGRLGQTLGLRSLAAAATGGFAVGGLVLRRPADALASAGVSASLLAALAAWGAVTRDDGAVRDPQLTGLLEKAPLVLGDLRTVPDRLNVYRDQLADLLRTGAAAYRRLLALPDPPPDDAIRLVHVSDIHLSPLALPLARVLVAEYAADLVVDTGDLTDWGTPPEGAVAAQIADLGVPYVFVKGNHDSTGIADAVARQPGAVVLRGETAPVSVAGVRFVGLPDPRFTPDKTTGHDTAGHLAVDAARRFAEELRSARSDADVALIHAPAAARELVGVVPLVLSGDTHVRALHHAEGTVLLTQGTSGGAGLRAVQDDPPPPFSLSVLFLDRTTRRLHTVDEVTLDGLGRTGLSIRRSRVAELPAAS